MKKYIPILMVATVLACEAQITITDMETMSNQTVRLWFHADGSANYTVQFSPDLSDSNGWEQVAGATIAGLGGNDYEAAELPATNSAGFFRIQSLEDLRAWFDEAEINIDEGAGTIELLIHFNGHFQGILTYTVEGTGIDSIDGLSGEVLVDGTSASITINLQDNTTIDQLRYLSISLQGASGLSLGSPSSATVNIEENDAIWQGILQTDTGTLGFQLQMLDNGANLLGKFGSGGFGFFPSNPLPAEVTLSETTFAASVTNILVSEEATLLGTPMELALNLSADDALENESIEPGLIEGIGSLIIDIPDMPHLNATNQGIFVLQKPPIAPSTNEVELVEIP